MHTFTVRQVTWCEAHDALSFVRRKVFIEEQLVPEEMEWEHADRDALHVLAEDELKRPIGCGRLLTQEGRIGRMAVLNEWRGHGVGSAMLKALMTAAQNTSLQRLELHAQTQALAFYQRFDFEAYGEEFEEAGIKHYSMRKVMVL